MIGKEVIESEPITGSEVKEILEEYADDNELNYEQNLTLNHISRFRRYSVEDAKEIYQILNDDFQNSGITYVRQQSSITKRPINKLNKIINYI